MRVGSGVGRSLFLDLVVLVLAAASRQTADRAVIDIAVLVEPWTCLRHYHCLNCSKWVVEPSLSGCWKVVA